MREKTMRENDKRERERVRGLERWERDRGERERERGMERGMERCY